MKRYQASTSPKCLQCNKPMTGAYFQVEGGGIHGKGDCMALYREAQAPKCIVCAKAMLEGYYSVTGGSVHADTGCYDEYVKACAS